MKRHKYKSMLLRNVYVKISDVCTPVLYSYYCSDGTVTKGDHNQLVETQCIRWCKKRSCSNKMVRSQWSAHPCFACVYCCKLLLVYTTKILAKRLLCHVTVPYLWTFPRAKVVDWCWKRGRLGQKEGHFWGPYLTHANSFQKEFNNSF